jgi:hypothetical protein
LDAISNDVFHGDPPPQIDPPSEHLPVLGRVSGPEICSTVLCMACMTGQQGTPAFPDYSLPRNTWVTLAMARDDFVREYYYRIVRLMNY